MAVLFQAQLAADAVHGAGELHAPRLGRAAELAGDVGPRQPLSPQVGELLFSRAEGLAVAGPDALDETGEGVRLGHTRSPGSDPGLPFPCNRRPGRVPEVSPARFAGRTSNPNGSRIQ